MFSLQLQLILDVPIVAEGKSCQKYLMPLPLPRLTDVEQIAAEAGELPSTCSDDQEWDRRVWLFLVVPLLNSLREGRDRRFTAATAQWCRRGEPQAAQRKE